MSKLSSRRRSKTVKDKLPIKQRSAYGAGHVLNDLIANALFSYMIIFLTNVVHISNSHSGLVILFGQLADGIFTPIIGIACDRTVCRYGRRKVWHLIGTIISTAAFPMLLIHVLKDDASNLVKVVYYVCVVIVFQFGWACVQISHLSLTPEISRRKNERVELNAIRSAVTFLCGIYAYGATWILLGQSEEFKITPKVWKEFMYLSFIIVVTGNICNIAFHVVIKEPLSLAYLERLRSSTADSTASVLPSEPSERSFSFSNYAFVDRALDTNTSTSQQQLEMKTLPQCNGATNMATEKCVTIKMGADIPEDGVTKSDGCGVTRDGVFDVIDRSPAPCWEKKSRKDWLKSPGIYKNAVVYTCTRIMTNLSQAYFPHYLTDTLNFQKEAIAYFPLVVLISALLASILVKPVSKKLGQKITFIIGTTMCISACVWFYFQSVSRRNAVYAPTVLIGSGGSVMLVSSLSMIADLVGNDKHSGAFVYGTICFIDKFTIGAAIATIQSLNPREHHVDHCLQCNEYVRFVQSVVPGTAGVIGLLTVIIFYNSNLTCKIKADCSDSSVQVNFDQQWPVEREDDADHLRTASTENCLCFQGPADCNDGKAIKGEDTRF